MEAKKFKNFTDRDFIWKFNGIPHTFPAGMEIYLESDKADHFAKHLVDRELNVQGVVTENQTARAEVLKKIFPTVDTVSQSEALNIEEVKKEVKKRGKKAEKEFPDLEANEDEDGDK